MFPVSDEELPIPLGDSPLGNAHDFYSEGDYWWPNPDNRDGPYARRDGFVNPHIFNTHRERLITASRIMAQSAVKYHESGNTRFLRLAEKWFACWFLNPETAMNPNLEHAQAIPGICSGRSIGIIDSIHLSESALAFQLLRKNGEMQQKIANGVEKWFSRYLDWLCFSRKGIEERNQKNNHGTAWSFQAAAFAASLGRNELLDELRREFKERWLSSMASDGSFPLELLRTRPLNYSIFQMELMCGLAVLLSSKEENLFHFRLPDGRGMELALSFLVPKLADPQLWRFPQDAVYAENLREKQPFLLLASSMTGKIEYAELYRSMPERCKLFELERNCPIHTPELWLKINRQKNRNSSMKRRNVYFTLTELLITIAVIAIIAGLLLPALGAARKKAHGINCVSNQKQLGMGMTMYLNAYDDMLPKSNVGSPYWSLTFCQQKFITIPILLCPSVPNDWFVKKWRNTLESTLKDNRAYDSEFYNTWAFVCYGYNAKLDGQKMTKAKSPGKLVLFGDSATKKATLKLNCFRINDTADESNYYLYVPHGGLNECNVIHADGHIQTYHSAKPMFEGVQALYAGPWKNSNNWKIQ